MAALHLHTDLHSSCPFPMLPVLVFQLSLCTNFLPPQWAAALLEMREVSAALSLLCGLREKQRVYGKKN